MIALVAGVVLVARWAVPKDVAFGWLVKTGYWWMLGLVVLLGRGLVVSLRGAKGWAELGGWKGVGVLGLIVVVSVMWVAHERPGFKILADEVLLLGTSMGMHLEREAMYPTRATDVRGHFEILSGVLDKRPLMFPFLVATVHDLTGYRPENAFYFNMGLGVIFLGVAYVAGRRFSGGQRWAGVMVVLLFAGLPLMAQQATGGGFELLNLTLIAGLTVLMARYLEEPGEGRLEAMIFCALALAATRYESVIFLVPAGVAALWGWAKAGRVVLSWPLVASPVFLLPLLMQNRLFSGGATAWELASMPGATTPFGLHYFAPNLGHGLAFFFEFSGSQPSSAWFAALGLGCLPVFGLWVARVLREREGRRGDGVALGLMGVGLGVVTLLLLVYFWGQFDHPVIRRLSLPVHWLMALAIVVTVGMKVRSRKGWQVMAGLALVAMFFQGIPVLAKQAYRTTYTPGVEMDIRRDFLRGQEDRNVLVIDRDSVFWITHKVAATPVGQALLRKDALIFHLRNRSFGDMLVFQVFNVNPDTGEMEVLAEDDLGEDFELETVLERRVLTMRLARISRVTAIREGGEVAAEAMRTVTPVEGPVDAAGLMEARGRYLENWIRNLP